MLAKVVDAHPELSDDELRQTWGNFLESTEHFLVRRGHQPADFLAHFDALRESPLYDRQDELDRLTHSEVEVGRLHKETGQQQPKMRKVKLHATPAERRLGETVWARIQQFLQARLNPKVFCTWFEPTRGLRLVDNTLAVEAPNDVFVRWLGGDGVDLVAEALFECAPRFQVKYFSAQEFELVETSNKDEWACPGCAPPHRTKAEHTEAILAAG